MKDATELLESRVLTREARAFLQELERRFGGRRLELLLRRQRVQAQLDAGWNPGFLEETREIRDGEWRICPFPAEIADRRVEITGPVSRKMMIQALNSGARVYMADFEDSHSPTWVGTLEGQVNLMDAVRGSGRGEREPMVFEQAGKRYEVSADPAVLFVRPRGWHLEEAHFEVDGHPMSASLFDFGLYFFHNARERVARGSAPYFYLPKMESHLEARLWNEVFVFAQERLGVPRGTIKATVLIETILAAFEMDEILWELREHSAGLNCGRWDYIFSFIKKFRRRPEFLLPDRQAVAMTSPFLDAYCKLLVRTCHRRGAHAMGGMAAQIPIKDDPVANEAALEKVRADKRREVSMGFDGTWVAHPALVQVAREIFDRGMPAPNQIGVDATTGSGDAIHPTDLLAAPRGAITRQGFRLNIEVALDYIASWLRGVGCVPLHHLMEDAATAEISRAQLWQWVRHPEARFDGEANGARPTIERFRAELASLVVKRPGPEVETAARLLDESISSDDFPEFLTLPAYQVLVAGTSRSAPRAQRLSQSTASSTAPSTEGESNHEGSSRLAL